MTPLFQALFAHKWTILIITAICGLGTALAVSFATDFYKAEGSLLFKLGREFIYRPELAGLDPENMFRLQEMVNSESEILESRNLASSVVEELGIDQLYPEMSSKIDDPALRLSIATATFINKLSVRTIEDSSVVKVTFEHSSGSTAARAINLLLERFLDRHTEIFGSTSIAFLEGLAGEARDELARTAKALQDFQQEHGLADPERSLELLVTRQFETQFEAQSAEARLAQVIATLLGLEDLDSGGSAELDGSAIAALALGDAVDKTLAEHLRLRILTHELAENYQPESRRVGVVDSQLATVESFLLKTLEGEKRFLEARMIALAEQSIGVAEQIQGIQEASALLRNLQNEVVYAEARVAAALGRLEEGRVARQLDEEGIISVKILDQATAPLKPQGLSRMVRIVLASMAGLIFAVVFVLLRYVQQHPDFVIFS